jgi:alanyl-tRNA synthetase
MTEHLYYTDSFLYEFEAEVLKVEPASVAESRPAVILNRTAFYPTSGGQVFDTGLLVPSGSPQDHSRVIEVSESDDGYIRHFVDKAEALHKGLRMHGNIDVARRRDHMQQHSGQHVLSAAFVRLFNMPTVSFHMGEDSCSIDLDTKSLTPDQMETVERAANEVIAEDRPVEIRFVSQEEALGLGLRKLPPSDRGQLRLIAIRDYDLSACGGTHVRSTGQIGCILLRKAEKVKQGIRVEFVCGQRAVRTARRDYTTLAESAGLFSAHMWDLPQQIVKAQEEAKGARRQREQLLDELAEQHAFHLLSETRENSGRKVIRQMFTDRDLAYVKLLAQKLTRLQSGVVALLGTTVPQPSVVVAASPGEDFDLGALLKTALGKHGGRGGGGKDMAQGGVPSADAAEQVLSNIAAQLSTNQEAQITG